MKSIPRRLSLLVLLSASGLVSAIDRVALPRFTATAGPLQTSARTFVATSPARTTGGIGWKCVTPAPLGPASTAGRAGTAPVPGF